MLDVRGKDEFAAGHLKGSLNVGLDGNYASWAGSVLDLDAPVVLIADAGTEREAAMRLARIGLDNVMGYLEGGSSSLQARPDLIERVARTTVEGAAAANEKDGDSLVLDVRMPGEVANAHVEGSLAIPLGQLRARLDEVPRDKKLLVHCKTGYRSMAAASLLLASGFDARHVVDVEGGIDAWIESGAPGVVGEGCPAG